MQVVQERFLAVAGKRRSRRGRRREPESKVKGQENGDNQVGQGQDARGARASKAGAAQNHVLGGPGLATALVVGVVGVPVPEFALRGERHRQAKPGADAHHRLVVDGEVPRRVGGWLENTCLGGGVGHPVVGHGGGGDGVELLLVERELGRGRVVVLYALQLLGDRAAVVGIGRSSSSSSSSGRSGDVVDEDGGEEIAVEMGTVGARDGLEKAPEANRLHIRNAEFPQRAKGRGGAVQSQGASKRGGDDLVQGAELGLGGTPVLDGVADLRNKDVFHQRHGDERPWWKMAAMVDAGDEVGGHLGFGHDGVELAIPSAVGLEDEPEVLVVVDEADLLRVEGERPCRRGWVAFVRELKNLGLGQGKVQAPSRAPLLHMLQEVPEDFVLGGDGLPVLVDRPARTVVRKQGENRRVVQQRRVEVVDVDGEEQRREDTALGHPSSRRKPVGCVVVLCDAELTVGQEASDPRPGLAMDLGVAAQLEEQQVVGHPVEGLDDVEKHHRQLTGAASAKVGVGVPEQAVDVIESGQVPAEPGLVVGEEMA